MPIEPLKNIGNEIVKEPAVNTGNRTLPLPKEGDGAERGEGEVKSIEAAVKEVSEHVKMMTNSQIRLEIDSDLNKVLVKITDSETGELIRQIPPEEMIQISKRLKRIQGILFNEEA